MKRIIIKSICVVIILLSGFSNLVAQTILDIPLDIEYKVLKSYSGLKSGELIKVSNLIYSVEKKTNPQTNKDIVRIVAKLVVGNSLTIDIKDDFKNAFECIYKSSDDIWYDYMLKNNLIMISRNGVQYDLRKDLENDALSFIQRLQNSGRAFVDPYLESYLYGLMTKIAPKNLIDRRPNNANIVILNDNEPNAFAFANGTICITTGMLSMIHTEDELAAVLAHEIAHFVLDHSINNINTSIKRKALAEFVQAITTAAVAIGETIIASENPYYIPGAATASAILISNEIASSYLEGQGMKYNHEQENEADLLSKLVIKQLGYDENALSTVLSRMHQKQIEERCNYGYFSSYTHPSLIERISRIGEPNLDIIDPLFEKKVSFAISSVAISKYSSKRFSHALRLVDQNINNGVATSDDYIIRAYCLLSLFSDEENNLDALNSIIRAKTMDPSNVNLYKSQIILLLRLDKKEEAKDVILEYMTTLSQKLKELENIKSGAMWEYWYIYFTNEYDWASKMQYKVVGL